MIWAGDWLQNINSMSTTKHFPGFDRLYELSNPLVRGAFVPRLVMEFDQERIALLEKTYQEEQAKRLSEITDHQELLMAKLSFAELTPAKRAKSSLMVDFGYELLIGKANINTPLRIKWDSGRAKPDDVEWNSGLNLVVFSGRVKNLLEEHGITGWKGYPIDLYDKLGVAGGGLQRPGCDGPLRATADPVKAIKRLTAYPGGVFPEYYGNYFDPESWDSSDIFIPESGGLFIFITERVKTLLKKQGQACGRGCQLS